MRRWFLSYHSADQALAERLKAAIERKDSASHVFFAPTKNYLPLAGLRFDLDQQAPRRPRP
jgi:hypothetical protein